MSEQEQENGNGQPQGAFGKDKAYGNRIDLVFAIGEPFLLLGAKEDEQVETKFGQTQSVKLLCQKISPDTGAPQGAPIRCVTVASAIVEKALAITPEELAAGPVVQLQHVQSKRQGGQTALVLSWMRNLADEDDFSEFGLDAGQVGRITDLARPEGQRIPL